MKNKKYHVAGVIFTSLLGTLLHFTYKLSEKNVFVGIFSAVNESVWEHLKLLFIPILIFSVIEYFCYGRDIKNFIPVKFLSMLLGIALITIIHYTYVGIIGRHFLVADSITFLIAILSAYFFSFKLLDTDYLKSKTAVSASIVGLLILISAFVLFTFVTPEIALFEDSTTGEYGIE